MGAHDIADTPEDLSQAAAGTKPGQKVEIIYTVSYCLS